MDTFKDHLGEKIVILGHHNADPDAIGAAVGVGELARSLHPNADVNVVMPNDISTLSRKIIKSLELTVFEEYHDTFDTVFIVDTGSLNQLGPWEEKITQAKSVIIIIDHHSRNKELEKKASLYLVEEDSSSASEIVFKLMENSGYVPTLTTAKALLAGMMFDSKFLSIGSGTMFRSISKLLEITGDISEIKDLFSSNYSISEKIARLKAAQRMNYHRINGWVIAVSELGSYQSSGARALISLGADIAIVTGTEKDSTRSSLRSTNRFYSETGLQLGELVSQVSKELDGDGSGHPTAAGFNGACEIDDFNTAIFEELMKTLSVKN